MCDSPIKIKNLNRFKESSFSRNLSQKMPWKDFVSEYINVPCGHCKSCIRQKQDGIVQRVQLESQKNHLFMLTLTYAPEALPILDVNGKKIRYADTSDLRNMIKMMRKDNAFGIPFRFLAVSELGSLRGRPHFHVLLLFPKEYFPVDREAYISSCESFASKSEHYFTALKYWRRNLGSRRSPDWLPLTRYHEVWHNGILRKNYDFHYVNPFLTKNGVEDCGMYVIKYMFKPSNRAVKLKAALALNLAPDEFRSVWEKVRPRYFASIGFGYNAKVQLKSRKFDKDEDIINQLKLSIKVSKEALDYPAFFHPHTGRSLFVSQYYLKNNDIYSFDDRKYFWDKKHDKTGCVPGDINLLPEETLSEFHQKVSHFDKTIKHCDELGFDSDFELLDD